DIAKNIELTAKLCISENLTCHIPRDFKSQATIRPHRVYSTKEDNTQSRCQRRTRRKTFQSYSASTYKQTQEVVQLSIDQASEVCSTCYNGAVTGKLHAANSGNVAPLTSEQLLDKDVRALYQDCAARNVLNTEYLSICCVIYYMGDPNSPPMQEGLNEDECLRRAKQNYELPDSWVPTPIITNIIAKFRDSEFTILNTAAISLQRAVNTSMTVADKYNDLLTRKLVSIQTNVDSKDSLEATSAIVSMLQQIRKEVVEFPSLVDKLKAAREAVLNEAEDVTLRGGGSMSESMNARFAIK
ncbi:MAG: hypothetical protein EZS28_047050, partial [Streblomastix strix]